MAKYAELEASVNVSVQGEITGAYQKKQVNEAAGNTVKGGECRESTDTEKRGVTV